MKRDFVFGYKIAIMTFSAEDALKMLIFYTFLKVSVICMGENGKFARILGPVVGNVIHYVSMDAKESTGPGQ